MALRRDMPIRDERPGDDEDSTVYQGSRGWWHPAPEKPVPGTPKK